MTPTAIELWNDENFLFKRIEEQKVYQRIIWLKWRNGNISDERFELLYESASSVLYKFADRLEEIQLKEEE